MRRVLRSVEKLKRRKLSRIQTEEKETDIRIEARNETSFERRNIQCSIYIGSGDEEGDLRQGWRKKFSGRRGIMAYKKGRYGGTY